MRRTMPSGPGAVGTWMLVAGGGVIFDGRGEIDGVVVAASTRTILLTAWAAGPQSAAKTTSRNADERRGDLGPRAVARHTTRARQKARGPSAASRNASDTR